MTGSCPTNYPLTCNCSHAKLVHSELLRISPRTVQYLNVLEFWGDILDPWALRALVIITDSKKMLLFLFAIAVSSRFDSLSKRRQLGDDGKGYSSINSSPEVHGIKTFVR